MGHWKLILIIFFQIIFLFPCKSHTDTIKIDSLLIKSELDKLINSYFSPKPKPILSLGLTNGLLLSKMHFPEIPYLKDPIKMKFRPGYEINIKFEVPILRMLDASLQIQYIQENLSKEVHFIHTDATQIETLKMIEFPILFRYNLLKSKLQPTISVGGSISWILDSKVKYIFETSDLKSEYSVTQNCIDYRKIYNSTLMAGIGLKYSIDEYYFLFDCVYNSGLTDQNHYCYDRRPNVVYFDITLPNYKLQRFTISLSLVKYIIWKKDK